MALQDILKNINPERFGLKILSADDLHAVQKTLEMMLHDFDEVCKEHDIEWCLFGGSVIGAVRHDGFIPWDDDVDIFMTRDNYNRFREVAISEIKSKYLLKEPGRKKYIYHFPQLQLRYTEIEPIQTTMTSNDGLFIDIFILENTPDNKVLRFLHGLLCTLFLFIDSAIRQNECREHILRYVGTDKKIVKSVNKRAVFAKLFSFRSFEKWLAATDRCFAMCKNNNSRFVACPSGRLHYFGEIYLRSEMCNYVKHKFGSYYWNIPKGYKYYLSKRYGTDYMTVPPKDKQEKHLYVKLNLHGNSKGDIS